MESIALWFAGTLGKYISPKLAVFIVSLVPILECRGGLIASALLKVDIRYAVPLCVLGNILPIPFILVNSSIDTSHKNLRSSLSIELFNCKTLCAILIEFSFFVPDFIIIAKSSALDNTSGPYSSNFSYGLSDIGSSFIFNRILSSFQNKILPPSKFAKSKFCTFYL